MIDPLEICNSNSILSLRSQSEKPILFFCSNLRFLLNCAISKDIQSTSSRMSSTMLVLPEIFALVYYLASIQCFSIRSAFYDAAFARPWLDFKYSKTLRLHSLWKFWNTSNLSNQFWRKEFNWEWCKTRIKFISSSVALHLNLIDKDIDRQSFLSGKLNRFFSFIILTSRISASRSHSGYVFSVSSISSVGADTEYFLRGRFSWKNIENSGNRTQDILVIKWQC